MTEILIADSIQPVTTIPLAFRHHRNKGVLLYADGTFAIPLATARMFPRREWISTRVHYQHQAAVARFIDVERFDAGAADFPPFQRERDELVLDGTVTGAAGVYCSIDPDNEHGVHAVIRECRLAGQRLPEHWWIAWYTGHVMPPDVFEVCGEIKRLTGETVNQEDIYAVQWQTGHYDLSVTYQVPQWDPSPV